jgi:hypothetical protein
MILYEVETLDGWREWHAEDEEHALDQHYDAFPDERVMQVVRGLPCTQNCCLP